MIKTIAAAAAAALVSVAGVTAHATDLYGPVGMKDGPIPIVAAPPLWTGFYGGFHLGAAWTDLGARPNTFYDGAGGSTSVTVNDIVSATGFGGGQIGYNWQFAPSFVLGLEADFDGIGGNNERGSTVVTHDGQGIRNVFAAKLTEQGGFAGDVTGRLGYAWANWMLYAKGGFAWFDPYLQGTATVWNKSGGAMVSAINNGEQTGWTAGAGVEWKVDPRWSVKAEYLYYDFSVKNNWNVTSAVGNVDNNWKWFGNDLTVNTIKLGLNYHLASYYTPLK